MPMPKHKQQHLQRVNTTLHPDTLARVQRLAEHRQCSASRVVSDAVEAAFILGIPSFREPPQSELAPTL